MSRSVAESGGRRRPLDPAGSLFRILLAIVVWLTIDVGLFYASVLLWGDDAVGLPDTAPGFYRWLLRIVLSYAVLIALLRLLSGSALFPSLRGAFRGCAPGWYAAAIAAVPCLLVVDGLLLRPLAFGPYAELLGPEFLFAFPTLGAGERAGVALATAAVLCLLQPLVEEGCFRGLLHAKLRRSWRLLPAALLSASLFALSHGDAIAAPSLLLLGLFLAWLYERSGSLWPCVVAHAALNGVVVLTLVAS